MNYIDIKSKEYPKSLLQIKDPPLKLFFKGIWDPSLFEHCLGVVGSRKMTTYGKSQVKSIVPVLCNAGITIVSGFMYGIDAESHQAAVNGGGKTIAVMPCGIDLVHPEYQDVLYEQIIASGGLVLSEYEGSMPPALWTYPRRNRIVAGISSALLVVEAGKKSGALITAKLARNYAKTIFSIPGPINSPVSMGTNRLIRDGAVMCTGTSEILGHYNLQHSTPLTAVKEKEVTVTNKTELKIIQELESEPLEIDTLARKLKLPAGKIGAVLSRMSLKNVIQEQDGKVAVIKDSIC